MSIKKQFEKFSPQEFLQGKGKLELLTGVLAARRLKRESDRQAKNIEAEDAAVRQTMGWEDPQVRDDDMEQIVLGDYHNSVSSDLRKRGLGTIAALALGAMVPGAGVAGYLASQYLAGKADPVVEDAVDNVSDVDIGLGRLEDYASE